MAYNLEPKAAAEVLTYRWAVPAPENDDPATVATVATGITVDSAEVEYGYLVLTVSGGTEGATGSVVATFTTDKGATLEETFYIPIVATAATGTTVRDVIGFALRKVYGIGEEAPADAVDDALERLSDMLLEWQATGADVGATFPLSPATVLYCKPSYQSAIKANLAVAVADLYGREITPQLAVAAVRGLQHIKNDQKPDVRTGASYY